MRSATRNAAACFVGCVCFALLHDALAAPPANLQPAAALQDEQEARVDPRPEYVPGEILVKFVENARVAAISNARRRIGAQQLKSFPSIGVALWKLPPDTSVHRGIELLSVPAARGSIEYAEPNYIYYNNDFPNDPLLGELWGMHNIGQTGGTLDADIDAPEAWDFQTGSSSVVVGIIDTGIDYTHEDLAANIWVNASEIAGNGIDDDGNGFIDDVMGWDFVNDDNDPFDDRDHGSHTAGTVGAVGNNGIGVTGVNWNVTLMPLKFLNSSGSGTTDDAIDAILYAASFEDEFGNKIVRITNNSWGGGRRSNALKQAIEASGALFVASAGNSGSSRKKYPAAYDLNNIISVAATDDDDELAGFSNFSASWVDLGAPGVSVLSTLPNNGYGVKSGTSMAAPHVAGVAALLMADDPTLDILAVKDQLMATVDLLPSLEGKTVSGGRINALNALLQSPPPPDTTPPDAVTNLAVDLAETTFDSITLNWTATGDDGAVGTAFLYDVRYATSPITNDADFDAATQAEGEPLPQPAGLPETFTATGLAGDTTYYLGLKVADEAGNFSDLSNVVFETTHTPPPSIWTVEIVASGGSMGTYLGLDFDAAGLPGIVYNSSAGAQFAHFNGVFWEINNAVGDGTGIDFAYDPLTDNPTISYGWGKLRFANFDGSSWDVTVVETNNARNDVTSLVYNLFNPSISYRKRGDLKLARFDGSSWQKEIVDPDAGARYSALAFDNLGNPAIAYSDDIDGNGGLDTLKFAHFNGASWDIEVVDTGPTGYGVYAALAYDPTTGYPAMLHDGDDTARFVRWDGTAWVIEALDETVNFVRGCALIFGPDGTAYAAWAGDGQLKVATRDPILGTWETEIVDTASPFHLVLKLDHAGILTVCYRSGSSVRFARRDGP